MSNKRSKLSDGESTMLFVKPEGGGPAMGLALSEPQPEEECCIAMEPILEHRVEWMPLEGVEPQPGPLLSQPSLRKATLPCGHGFHALALLYHFAKNEMVCPCCRQGMPGKQVAPRSLPPHLRAPIECRLETVLRSERAEQVESDAEAVARLLEQEVPDYPLVDHDDSVENGHPLLALNRQVLILFAYPGMNSLVPPLVQEIPLSSSHSRGTLVFSSSGSSVRDLNRNLRLMPVSVRAFELVVATRTRYHGVLSIARSQRFEHGQGYVPCVEGVEGVELHPQTEDMGTHIEFFRVSLRMPRAMLHTSIMRSTPLDMREEHLVGLLREE
jgi:hypothetical protein